MDPINTAGQQPTPAPQTGATPVPPTQPTPSATPVHHAGYTAQPAYATPAATQPAAGTAPMPPAAGGYYQQAPATPPAAVAAHAAAKKGSTAKTFWIAFAGAAVACVLAFAGLSIFNGVTGSKVASGSSTVIGSDASTPVTVDDDATLAEAVSDKVLPSVVAVDVYTSVSSSYGGFFGSSNSSSSTLTKSSLGSGIVISKDGYLLTNNHVVEGAEKLMATVNGTSYEATVVGTDPSSDLAVLKVDATDLTPIEIGSSDDLKTGEWVMSAGSPFGLEQSVATGIVSATSRSVGESSESNGAIYAGMIQTDAAINPGNSGGALVDADGKLIGVNTLIASSSGNYSGVGFAIPVDYAIDIAQQIIDGKTPSHAQLGVSSITVNAQIAQRYGLAADAGAYVSSVNTGSGAEKAGLQEGDIITKFNGETVASTSNLRTAVRSCAIGDTVEVEYNRNGTTSTVSVTLGAEEVEETESGNSYGYGYGYSPNGYSSSDSSSSSNAA